MKTFSVRTFVLYAILLAAVLLSFFGLLTRESDAGSKEEILLLVSDQIPKDDSRVTIWKDAAAEEGINLAIMHDSEFLRPWTDRLAYAGIILPDHVHTVVGEILYHELHDYVEQGGKLMLVYDAGTKSQNNTYFPGKAIFSNMAGIDYALYDRLRDKTIALGALLGTQENLDMLQIPPGKYMPATKLRNPHPLLADRKPMAGGWHTITGYGYQKFQYPGFVSGSAYRGQALLLSPAIGLAAGYQPYGKGGTLFVNLPLGYLKGRTDGALLHGFLKYFSVNLLNLPILSPVPNGIGGLIMNWHIDSNAALKPIQDIEALGIYSQGPYSIHITAGPDTRKFNDGLGLNVPKNPAFQKWIRDEVKRGNTIGSHGGWIHDYFGKNVSDDNRKDFERFLVLNKQALEEVSGTPMLEYSAPVGNQPEWVTSWLEDQGFLAYYFTGNTGMGPTRSYRDGRLTHKRIWSFPILAYKDVAAFEEMHENKLTPEEVTKWLVGVADFTVRHRVARLIYFHPPGMMFYPRAMRAWLSHTAGMKRGKSPFQWYTMTDLTQFLNAREKVTWKTDRESDTRIFTATHPVNLSRQTWILSRAAYGRPVIMHGNAEVTADRKSWFVVAKSGKKIIFKSNSNVQK
jgi:hypothetical protein